MFCGKYFRDTVWYGDHTMKIFILLKKVFKDLKIISSEELILEIPVTDHLDFL